MRFSPYSTITLTVTLLSFSPAHDGTCQDKPLQNPDYRVGITLLPDSVSHQGNEGMRAAMIDTASSAPTVKILNTPYVPVGTQFAGWLRDGNVLLTTTHVIRTPDCRYDGGLGNVVAHCPVVPLVVDSYVVNPKTGTIKYCLTCNLHNDQSIKYLYSQTPQPVYDPPESKVVSYYVVSTHLGPVNPEGTGTDTEVWTVDANGENAKKLLHFGVGMHGCQVSPNGRWLACQAENTTNSKEPLYCWFGVLLIDTKDSGWEGGTNAGKSCVGNTDEYSRDSVAIWSPDNSGFVYFSQKDNGDHDHPTNGWLNYYEVPGKTVPKFRIAEGKTPIYFCGLLRGITCDPTGRGPVWSPCETAGPCPRTHGASKWLFFSIYSPSQGTSGPREVIGKVSIDKPAEFIPVTGELKLDAGYPSISSDGSRIAFLAAESTTDRRKQLYTMAFKSCKQDFKYCKFVKLTCFGAQSFTKADNPQWPSGSIFDESLLNDSLMSKPVPLH